MYFVSPKHSKFHAGFSLPANSISNSSTEGKSPFKSSGVAGLFHPIQFVPRLVRLLPKIDKTSAIS
jgi:hypothetical protein